MSCLVNHAAITPEVSEGESKTMLCGTVKTSADQVTWSLTGNVDTDAGTDAGLFALTWTHAGETVDFEFTPSNDLATKVIGKLKLVPLRLGADEYGSYLDSDVTFPLVNFDPATAVTYGDAGALEDAAALEEAGAL